MTHVTCWLPLLLVVYIVWQAYHSSKLKDEILFLKRQKPRCENNLRGEISYFRKENEHLTYRINEVVADRGRLMYQLQEFKTKLQQSDSVSSDLKRELQEREEFLKSNKDKQEQLQTTIDELTKTVEALKQRLQVLCEPPKFACRSLLIAAKSGDLNNTKRLVTCSGDITKDNCESTDGFRFTPLIFAARNGHVELVQMLLEAGTNLERSSASGWTALHQAAKLERLEVCRLLLDWGANVDPLNVGRDTPLHLAARHGHLSVVKLLVERGADVGLKNDDGQTALHDSAGRGHLSVVKLFVERGADVRLKNVFGQTASDVARSAGREDVVEWLDSVSRG